MVTEKSTGPQPVERNTRLSAMNHLRIPDSGGRGRRKDRGMGVKKTHESNVKTPLSSAVSFSRLRTVFHSLLPPSFVSSVPSTPRPRNPRFSLPPLLRVTFALLVSWTSCIPVPRAEGVH